jgi:hypothetical protein
MTYTQEWIFFNDNRTNRPDKKCGIKIGRYLAVTCVAGRWGIFQLYGGVLVVDNLWFMTEADCTKVAEYINEQYSEYLGIWEVYPDWDVIGIARLSISQGEKIYNVLMKLAASNQLATYEEFIRLLNVRPS